jgi:hypothetical protein
MSMVRIALASLLVAMAAHVAGAQPVNPDSVARGKLDAAQKLAQQRRVADARREVVDVIRMPGVSASLRAQSYLMAGNLSFRERDYATARRAFKRLLDLPDASEEDRKAARLGLQMVDTFEGTRTP